MENTNIIAIFLTGLFTGGLTCMAVQGGLLASSIAQRSSFAKAMEDKEEKLKEHTKTSGNVLPILAFLVAKLIAYTILGFFLGSLGSFFQLSISVQATLQFVVAIFMIGTALNLLQAHPIFRYFIIQPPKFLTRLVRNQSKSTHFVKASSVEKDLFGPAILGGFTIFIPCGTTQAMMALAIASGNPWAGALILFAFILGTSPVFFLLGYFATRLGETMHGHFSKVAAYVIILLAIWNLNGAIALSGSTITFGSLVEDIVCTVSFCAKSPIFASLSTGSTSDGAVVLEQTITIDSRGYTPSSFNVKAGTAVTLNLVNNGGGGCAAAFTIPTLGVQRVVQVGNSDTVQFAAPSQPGPLTFMCSMGMYRGVINVI